ncbi:hypothetical protein GOP47_0030266 [Adiantum capillus-veneris]|nr:hypothetical protein GOP47_0030266 [Adiantum capillus-veneris]
MTREESKKCLLAESMVSQIKTYVARECQSSLELVEYVINPTYIKARVQDDTKQAGETMIVLLEQICKEALEEGLDYTHTWDMGIRNEVAELLMPKDYVKKWESSIRDEYNESAASVYRIKEIEPWEDFFDAQSGNQTATTIDPELLKILRNMSHQLHNIDQKLVGIAAGINDLKAIANHTQRAMELYGERVLAQCSKMLEQLNVSCPRYPYFTDVSNKIAKHYLVVAERLRCLQWWRRKPKVKGLNTS